MRKGKIIKLLLILLPLFVLWVFLLYKFFFELAAILLFVTIIPLAIVINFARSKRLRNIFITIFVIAWTLLFHYESLRAFYLEPLLGRELPKTKFLFPPAGWIMFYEVDNVFGHVEVYGVKGEDVQLIDPHDILRTRTIGYDNIHRNILSTAASAHVSEAFCRFLQGRFSYFEKFLVTSVYYPNLTQEPSKRYQRVLYQCGE